MRTQLLAAALLSTFTLACSAIEGGEVGESEEELTAGEKRKATIIDQTGTNIGIVDFTQRADGVKVEATIYVAPAGYHGFHVHGIGACSATFTSAGGHYNPTGATHGAHAGDMPSILVNANGSGSVQFVTDRFTLAELMDADGSAVILHAGADNFGNVATRYFSTTENVSGADSATKATGDAGSRLGCGVVK